MPAEELVLDVSGFKNASDLEPLRNRRHIGPQFRSGQYGHGDRRDHDDRVEQCETAPGRGILCLHHRLARGEMRDPVRSA